MPKINVLLTTFLLFFVGYSVSAQNPLSNIFRKFRNDEGVQHINLTGNISKMLQSKDQKLASVIDEMHVYIFSKGKNISPSDATKIKAALQQGPFELLINTKDKSGKVSLYGVEKNKKITDLYSELNYNGMNIYVLLKGNILLHELSKMNFDFDGSNLLKRVVVP